MAQDFWRSGLVLGRSGSSSVGARKDAQWRTSDAAPLGSCRTWRRRGGGNSGDCSPGSEAGGRPAVQLRSLATINQCLQSCCTSGTPMRLSSRSVGGNHGS